MFPIFIKEKRSDILYYLIILLISIIVTNLTSKNINIIYFSFLLFLFWRSKNDYFWLEVFFVIAFGLGGLFGSTTDLFVIGPIKLSLLPVFSIIAYIKHLKTPIKIKTYFSKPIILYFIYLFFLMFLGFVVIGNSGGGRTGVRYYYYTFVLLLYLPFVITIPKIISNYGKLLQFSKLVFISVFINLIGQFITIFFSKPVTALIDPNIYLSIGYYGENIRPMFGAFQSYLGMMLSLYFYLKKEQFFNRNYLIIIYLVSIFSIFITATRGWIIAFVIVLISAFMINKSMKLIKVLLIVTIVSLLLYYNLSMVKNQVYDVLLRMETLKYIVKGDLTAGGTNWRLTTRSDKVMAVFYKSPIIGNGFSFEAMEKNDQHVGHQNILMAGGIIGYAIILYFWIYLVYQIYECYRRTKNQNMKNAKAILLLIPFFLGLFIIHSSSTSLFGYLIYVHGTGNFFFIIIVLSLFNTLINETYKNVKLMEYK